MSKTREQFIDQCLTNLGVIAEGQSIDGDLVSKMDTIVDPGFATLAKLEIYYVQDPGSLGPTGGEIEDAAFLPLADWIANKACAAFNLPADQKMQTLAILAEATLITLSAPSRTFKRLRLDPAVTRGRRGWYGGWF